MSRSPCWLSGVLCAMTCGAALASLGHIAQAEEAGSPRAAMRAAAEAVAEVEPGALPRLGSLLPKQAPAPRLAAGQLETRDPLQVAVREAVEVELARELGAQDRHGPARGQSSGKSDGSADSGKDARDQAHGAALQAQGAKVVGAQNGQGVANGLAKGNGQGNGTGPGSNNGQGNGNGNAQGHGAIVIGLTRGR